MRIIKKKTWPELFQKVLAGEKKFDIRLADFEIEPGDTLVLEEYNPETKQYTGRTLEKKITFVTKLHPEKFNSFPEMEKYGLYGLGFDGLDISNAQKVVDDYIKTIGGYWPNLSMLARLVEEQGELARAMNIKYGGKKAKFPGDGREVEKELVDVFFTVLAIANNEGINLEKAFKTKLDKLLVRDKKVYNEGKLLAEDEKV